AAEQAAPQAHRGPAVVEAQERLRDLGNPREVVPAGRLQRDDLADDGDDAPLDGAHARVPAAEPDALVRCQAVHGVPASSATSPSSSARGTGLWTRRKVVWSSRPWRAMAVGV